MTSLVIKSEPNALLVDVSSFFSQATMTDAQFYEFCLTNRNLRIERSTNGEIIVMPPAFSDTGNRNIKLAQQVANWAEEDGTGEPFDSSAGFTLPNGATRSPDVSWIRLERWNALSDDEKASFAPICPDFVVELRSSSDTLTSLQDKLKEYLQNGAQLGLLVDRKNRTIHIYRPSVDPEVLENPAFVSCEPELPGFTLKMAKIW